MRAILILSLIAVLACTACAEPAEARSLVEKGNTFYRMGLFDEAGKKYMQAEKLSADSPIITYNLGNVYHQKLLEKQGKGDMPEPFAELDPDQQELVDKAVDAYKHSLQSPSPTLCGQALYNLGNTYAAAGMVNEAILSYREALRLLPDDEDTKHNLELLLQQKKIKRESAPMEMLPPKGLTNIVKMTGLTGPGTNAVKRSKGRGKSSAEGAGAGDGSQTASGGQGRDPEDSNDKLEDAIGPVAMPMQSAAQGVGVREGGAAADPGGSGVFGGQAESADAAASAGDKKKISKDPNKDAAGGTETATTVSTAKAPAPDAKKADYEAAPPRVTRDGRPLNRAARSTLERASKLEGKYIRSAEGADEPFEQPAAQDW